MASFSFSKSSSGAPSTTNAQQTLIENDNAGVDETGALDALSTLTAPSGTTPLLLDLTKAPAGAGVILNNAGTITATSARLVDVIVTTANATATATGAKITLNNSGTLSTSGTTTKDKGDVFRVNYDMPSGSITLNNAGTISSTTDSNDSQALRLGKVYTASSITITNGSASNTNATIKTADADAIRAGGVDPTGSNTAYGSSVITNYGTISASFQDVATGQLAANPVNAIDIGVGQAATVTNYGTIVGDESGLGTEVGYNGPSTNKLTFLNYTVTNYAGATIAGNNGAGIAVGETGVLGTATITNLGTISGNFTGKGRAGSSSTVPIGNGTGIYVNSTATIVNGSTSNTSASILGQGAGGTSTQGGATYNAINIANGTITNYGTIGENAATAAKAGAAVLISGNVGSTLTNYGAIAGVAGAAVAMGSGNDAVNLYTGSSEIGTIDGGAGTDTLSLGLGNGTSSASLGGVKNFEALNVNGGVWTITDAESFANGIRIAAGATLALGPAGSLTGAIVDGGSFVLASAGPQTVANVIGGTGTVVAAGSGTLTLSGANSYSGGTALNAGTLDLASAGAAGTGAITFGSGAQTLVVEQAALKQSGGNSSLPNTLASLGSNDAIDLRGVGTETNASFDASTNLLTLTGGTATVSLQLDASGAPAAGFAYGTTADGAGGSIVAIDQVATVVGMTTNPPSGSLGAGSAVTITLTMSKGVTIGGAAPVLNLSDGGTATLDASRSTATSLVFQTIVAAGQNASGISITGIANADGARDAAHVAADFSQALNQPPIGPAIDTTAPTVTIASVGGLTNQPNQIVKGTVDVADAGSTVSVLEGSTLLGSATVATDGSWSTAVTLSGNGTHTLTAQDTDAAGNTGTSQTVGYDLETTAPTVTITTAGGLTNQKTQSISGTVDLSADRQAAGTSVAITEGSTTLATASIGTDGSWTAAVTLDGEGQHSLTASDTDAAGNIGYSAPLFFKLDTTPPAVAITSDGGVTNQPIQTIGGTVSTADAGTTVSVSENGAVLGSGVVGTDGTWSAGVTLTGDGKHALVASDTDAAGNVGSSAPVTLVLDTAPPSVAITSAGGLTNRPGQTIGGTVDTADAGTAVTVLDGAATLGTAVVRANGSWSTAVTLSGDGRHDLVARDTDAAGNTGVSASVTFTLDTTAPVVAISGKGGITNQPTQMISGTVGAADAGTAVTVLDGATAIGRATVGSDGTWSAAVSLSGEGRHTLSAIDTDAAGNKGTSAAVTYTLDTTPPDVDITSDGGSVAVARQTLFGTGEAGSTITLSEGSAVLAKATVAANGRWDAAVTLTGNGTHTVAAAATDIAGNTGPVDTVDFTLDGSASAFQKGNLVLSVYGAVDGTGDYGDNEATPIALQQFTTDGTFVNQLILPQQTIVSNGVTQSVISGEYGSSSEGTLELSGDGKLLVIAGYAVNAQTYNVGGANVYGNAALAQSTSLTSQSLYTPVGRVIAAVAADGTVDTSTVLFNVFNGNNPRSVATIDGSTFFVGGQGISGDKTQGVYTIAKGSATPTAIDQSTDVRTAEIYNGTLYVSRDSKQPKNAGGTSNIASYGGLPTSATSPTILAGISKAVVLTSGQTNSINGSSVGQSVNLDPENFFFANNNTLYVADGGIPKQGGVGDGGLQKWTFDGSRWTLQYTLSDGLGIVAPGSGEGTTGLIGLTGKVVGNQVQLYASNETVGDLDQKYLFGITDRLDSTSGAGESFTTLITAAAGTNIRGIAFAPSTQAPVVSISGSGGLTNQPGQTISGSVDVADAGTTVILRDGTTALGSATVASDGSWTIAATLRGDGQHTLTATDTDAFGNKGTSNSITYTLDTAAPSVAIGSAGGLTNQPGQTVTGSVDVADAGTTVTVLDGATALGTAVVGTDGTWSTTVTLSGDGTHSLTATDTDAAGNTGTSAAVAYTLDTVAPTVAIGSAGGLTNQPGQTVAGSVDVADAGTTVTVFDGAMVLGTAVVGTDGTWKTAVTLSGDGQHSLTATDTDAAGNTDTSAAVAYTLDTVAPVVAIGSKGGLTNQSTQTIAGTVGVADAGTTVTVLDGATALTTAVVGTDGTWKTAVTLSGDGTHSLTATDADAAGNIGTSAAVAYTLDTVAPVVAITSAGGLTKAKAQTVTGTGEAGSRVAVLDGSTVLGTATVASNGRWSAAVTLSGEGRHNLTATDTDAAGNTGMSAAVAYTLDTVAPNAPGIALADDTGTSATDKVTRDATITVTSPEAGATLLYKTDSATTFSAKAPVFATDGSADGRHTVSVEARDAAGNVGAAATLSFTLDTVAPPVAIASAGGLTRAKAQTVAGTGEAGSRIAVLDGSAVLGTATVAANGRWSAAVTLSGDGQHSLTATDTDAAGNIGTSAAVAYTLDTVAPAAPGIALAKDTGTSSTDRITGDPTIAYTSPEAGATLLYKADSATTFSAKAPVFATDGSADGRHTVSVEAQDAAGNVGAAATLSFTLDTKAPAVAITSAGGLTKTKAQTVAGTGEAGSQIAVLDGSTVLGTATVASNGRWNAAVMLTGDGQHNLTATGTDVAGNTGTSAAVSYTLDTVAPVAPGIALVNDTGTSSTDKVTRDATITATSPEAGATLIYRADNQTSYSAAVPVFATDGSADGKHIVYVRAQDAAGNVGAAATLGFTLDTQAPTVAITSAGGSTTQAKQTIKGTVDVADAGSKVTLSDNGQAIGTAKVASDGTWASTVTLSGSGRHTIVASDTDIAGNAGLSNSLVFTLGSASANSSLNRMVQAMATMSDGSASSMTAASQPAAQDHMLAASHG